MRSAFRSYRGADVHVSSPARFARRLLAGVWREGDGWPLLVRNYDYAPERMDGFIFCSLTNRAYRWFRRILTIGVEDVASKAGIVRMHMDAATTRLFPMRSRGSAG